MILAEHSGDFSIAIIVALAVAGFKLVSWLGQKAKSEPGRPAPRETEEERTRRFLEALGVPAGPRQPPAPRREVPATLRQGIPGGAASRRPDLELPIPPFIPPQVMRQRRPPLPPPRPAQPRPARPLPQPVTRPEAAWRVPPLPDLPGLEVPAVPEYQTKSGSVSALPGERLSREPVVEQKPPAGTLRALLGTSASLRTAFVLREVLGPPPGLPGSTTGPTLSLS